MDGTGRPRTTDDRVFTSVVLLLFSAGWAANHFASMLPVLRDVGHLTSAGVNAAFGLYAVGLVPGLLSGGGLADRSGSRPVVVTGVATAAIGNLLMAFWHPEAGVMVGRLVVGMGVGLAVSAGTAWAANLRGGDGATFAGVVLTAGFAAGPIATGLLALVLPPATRVPIPFLVTVSLSLAAVATALVVRRDAISAGASSARSTADPARSRAVGPALAAAIPMALWVFSSATIAFVVLPGRMPALSAYSALLPGLAAAVGFGAGLGMQVLARRRRWGPRSGVAGAVLAAAGFALVAAGGRAVPVWLAVVGVVVLGSAYGLCLREGLTDVDRLAPPPSRGLVLGVFYVCTYLGFGLPVLLDAVQPALGSALPLLVLAAIALAAALVRAVHLALTDHLRR